MLKSKKIKLAMSAFSIAISFPTMAEITQVEKIRSLLITPYALSSPYSNKFITFGITIEKGCYLRDLGFYVFADVEGGNVNRSPDKDTKFVSPENSLDISAEQYRTSVNNAFEKISERYCLDVALAPITDIGMGDRSYFEDYGRVYDRIKLSIEGFDEDSSVDRALADKLTADYLSKVYDKGIDRLNAYVEGVKANNLSVTYKHYPLVASAENNDELEKEINEGKSKWGKPPSKLYQGYSEIEFKSLGGDEDVELLISKRKELFKRISSNDFIMLSNYLFLETDFTPYIASPYVQNDEFLQNFGGLIMSDDLFQLNVRDIDITNIFLNADLFIISSLKDAKVFINKVSDLAESDEKFKVALDNKFEKVIKRFPIKSTL